MRRSHSYLYVLVFFGAIVLLSAAGLVRADRRNSSLEERPLAQLPAFTAADVASGAYGTHVESYLSDQFAARNRWVKAHTVLSLRALGKVAMNGVVVGRGGILLGDLSDHVPLGQAQTDVELAATVAQLKQLDAVIDSYGGKLLVVGHPTKNSYLRAAYPSGFSFPSDLTRIRPRYFEALERGGIDAVDMAPVFEQHRKEKLYYDTDHHWTFRGAYLTYSAMMRRLGMRPLSEAELDEVMLPNRFVGSLNRKMAMAFPQTEKITIATPHKSIAYTRTQDGASVHELFKAHPAGETVAYGVYDQGDHAEVVVDTNRPELPTLLLVGDSFTNAIETLAWTGFDESRYVDLRHYTSMSLFDYVAKYKPDRVVILVRDERYLYLKGNGLFSGPSPSTETGE